MINLNQLNAISQPVLTPQQIYQQKFEQDLETLRKLKEQNKGKPGLLSGIGNLGSMFNAWLSDNKNAESQSGSGGTANGGQNFQGRNPGVMR